MRKFLQSLSARQRELVRYALVQGGSGALDYGAFTLLVYALGVGPVAANIVGRILAGVTAFVLHRSITFAGAKEEKGSRQAVLWFALLALNLPISSVLLTLLLRVCDMPLLDKIVSDIFCIVLNYWLTRTYIFRGRTNAPEISQ